MRRPTLPQFIAALALIAAIGFQARALYRSRHPQFYPFAASSGNKDCGIKKLSGVTNDGRRVCAFESEVSLQSWPRLCGCPDFCQSECQ